MIVRVNHVRFKKGQADKARAVAEKELVPLMKGIKGFVRWYALQASDNPDEGLSIGVWETKEDLERARGDSRYQAVVGKIQGYYAEQPSQRLFDVKSQG